MSGFDRVIGVTMESQTVSTADDPMIELQVPIDTNIEIIRVEIGVAEGATPVDEVQEIELYRSATPGTAGTGIAEQRFNGSGISNTQALRNLTDPGAGFAPLYQSAFHWQQGWLYLPVPEERIHLISNNVDNFGVQFPVAPAVAVTFSVTMVFGEFGL